MPAPTSTTTARCSPWAIVNWRPVGGIMRLPSITAVPALHLDSPVRVLAGCGPTVGQLDERRRMQMVNPAHQPVDGLPLQIGGLSPRYRTVDKLPWKKIADLVQEALPLAAQLEDPLPAEVLARQRLLPLAEAIQRG